MVAPRPVSHEASSCTMDLLEGLVKEGDGLVQENIKRVQVSDPQGLRLYKECTNDH